MTTPQQPPDVIVGVLQFTRKARLADAGVPFLAPFCGSNNCDIRSIRCHSKRRHDAWAKISRRTGELIEILGDTGHEGTERIALLLQHDILPCKYPRLFGHSLSDVPKSDYSTKVAEHDAVTVDGRFTRDRDDALSLRPDGDHRLLLGIHITDVTHYLVEKLDTLQLLSWARHRASSAYCSDGTSYPMLPPTLAHETFSLVAGRTQPCISVYLTVDVHQGHVISRAHNLSSWIHVRENVTYQDLATQSNLNDLRRCLERCCGSSDPEQQVAWAMTQYNLYFARFCCSCSNNTLRDNAILRVQPSHEQHAMYVWAPSCLTGDNDNHRGHAAFGGEAYGHFTSPIRRYADLHNQFVIKGFGLTGEDGGHEQTDDMPRTQRLPRLPQQPDGRGSTVSCKRNHHDSGVSL